MTAQKIKLVHECAKKEWVVINPQIMPVSATSRILRDIDIMVLALPFKISHSENDPEDQIDPGTCLIALRCAYIAEDQEK